MGSGSPNTLFIVQGDIILVKESHQNVANEIVDRLLREVQDVAHRFTMAVAGESGSGKSATALALQNAFKVAGATAVVLQQDDYYVLPPKFNDAARRANFAWVGTTEVQLDLLDEHLAAAQQGADSITKPLVIYDENRIEKEHISLVGADVVIAEGVYTSVCSHVDRRVFIARTRLETLEHRRKRGREDIDLFIEQVLRAEHEIVALHRGGADIVINADYEVEFITV